MSLYVTWIKECGGRRDECVEKRVNLDFHRGYDCEHEVLEAFFSSTELNTSKSYLSADTET